ncbi:lysostaphin resistance A-like protein [Rheinheimera gaetbuli]
MTMYAFWALAAAMCTVGVTVTKCAEPCWYARLARLPVLSLGLAATALLLALSDGFITPLAALLLSLLTGLALWLAVGRATAMVHVGGWLLLVLLALAAALHWLPGIQNPLLVPAQQLTPDAIAYTLYANFDKGWAGYCLLLAIWPAQHSAKWHSAYWRGFWPVWPVTVFLTMALALQLGLVEPALKWPAFALSFIFCNLFLTCVAEEALFRGVLQRPLGQWLLQKGLGANAASWLAIASVSAVFGLAHIGAGWAYALVAVVASIGYGWVYQRSGRIEVAVLAHFALNLVHFGLFTYPMLR